MKRLYFNILVLLACLSLSSCKEEEDPPLGIFGYGTDFFELYVTDKDGSNLLDPNVEGNILGNEINFTLNGEKYPLAPEYPRNDPGDHFFEDLFDFCLIPADSISMREPHILLFSLFRIMHKNPVSYCVDVDWGDNSPQTHLTINFAKYKVVKTTIDGVSNGNSCKFHVVK